MNDLGKATSFYLGVRRPPSHCPVLRVSVPRWLACLIFSRHAYDALHPHARLATVAIISPRSVENEAPLKGTPAVEPYEP